tara:strand:- start:1691 stop:4447 length:2757 start_codon:yes stop_codon:yes gene_type:complete
VSNIVKIELPSRFQFNRKLGTGRTAYVVLAKDQELHREVAIKLIQIRTSRTDAVAASVNFDSDTRRRARREVDLACRLRHPHIVAAYDFFETQSAMGLVQQAIEGSDWAAESTRTSEREQVSRMRKLALAVHYIHEQGWAHGDIKPENVLVDADGEPYLCDFGSARLLTDSGVAVGDDHVASDDIEINGTPAYMAPECAAGQSPASVAADVYSLGMLLIDRLTGSCPFSGTPASILDAVVHRGPPPLVSLGYYRNPRMQSIVDKATCHDPRDRYQTAAAFAEDLSHYLDNRPLLAKASNQWERWRLWGKRNPTMRVLSGLFVSVLVSAILLVTANWRSANLQSKRLIQSETQLNLESNALRKSERELTVLIETLRLRQAAVQRAESLSIQLRNNAEAIQLERLAMIEKSKKLEADAKQKMHALHMSIMKSKAANIRLKSLSEQSTAERSRLQSFTKQIAANESREAIDAAIASMQASNWDEMELALSAVHDDFRGFLYHHLSMIAFQGSVTPRTQTFDVPFDVEKVVSSPSAAALAAFSRAGHGVWINKASHRVVPLPAPDEIRNARSEITAAAISSDGNDIAIGWDHKGSSQRITTYHVTDDPIQIKHDHRLSQNVNAMRFAGRNLYALVSSQNGDSIGLLDLQTNTFVWQREAESDADARTRNAIMLLETQCNPYSTLAFALFSNASTPQLEIVCIDFRSEDALPMVHTFELGDVDSAWNLTSLFFSEGTAIGTVKEQAVSVEPVSLQTHDAKAMINRNQTLPIRLWRMPDGVGVGSSPLVRQETMAMSMTGGGMGMGTGMETGDKLSDFFPDSVTGRLVCIDRDQLEVVSVAESEDGTPSELVSLHSLPLIPSIRYVRGLATADHSHFVQRADHKLVLHPLQHRPNHVYVSVEDFAADLREFTDRNNLDAILMQE